jgi:23S rRNA-/tRNA-specific pseudouridylate synthase
LELSTTLERPTFVAIQQGGKSEVTNYNLELEFSDGINVTLPESPTARVRVYVQCLGSNVAGSHRYVTKDCVSDKEFDREIDRLIQELERIRRKGHAKFSAVRR